MPFGMPRSFQATANNLESTSVQVVRGCQQKAAWNGYMCQNDDLGVLLFESLDDDRMDRSAQPLYIQDEERGFNNRLNAYMDNCWDGAYTCQLREQRFPTFLDISRNYTIEYTGTPPKKQKFALYGDTTIGTKIRINYPDAGAYKLYAEDGTLAEPTDWDPRTETYSVPAGRYCGEHRYVGVENFLEFWIEPGCTLFVYPRDAIMLAVRLEWTLAEFYESDGIGKFTDRMAAALGIHRADLKVVQVFEGSVIIEFMVMAPEDDPNPQAALDLVKYRFETVAPHLGDHLGAPLMQILTSDGTVVPMDGYEDLESLMTNEHFANLIEEFLRERDERMDSLWNNAEDIDTIVITVPIEEPEPEEQPIIDENYGEETQVDADSSEEGTIDEQKDTQETVPVD